MDDDDTYYELDDDDSSLTCPECGGTGLAWEGWDCEYCEGTGTLDI